MHIQLRLDKGVEQGPRAPSAFINDGALTSFPDNMKVAFHQKRAGDTSAGSYASSSREEHALSSVSSVPFDMGAGTGTGNIEDNRRDATLKSVDSRRAVQHPPIDFVQDMAGIAVSGPGQDVLANMQLVSAVQRGMAKDRNSGLPLSFSHQDAGISGLLSTASPSSVQGQGAFALSPMQALIITAIFYLQGGQPKGP